MRGRPLFEGSDRSWLFGAVRRRLVRHRPPQQIALEVRAPFFGQAVQLRRGLHPFGGGGNVQAAPDAVDGADDGKCFLAGFDVLRERLVDLDLVEFERAQIAQRGIAGAEIVQRHFHAQRFQLVQPPACAPAGPTWTRRIPPATPARCW
ncbi:hypothetical protein G6F65_021980 [Rhizopus arrhizus]|nr:hypothetical protein G6F65_021980 [Rhizopus arrhizus]